MRTVAKCPISPGRRPRTVKSSVSHIQTQYESDMVCEKSIGYIFVIHNSLGLTEQQLKNVVIAIAKDAMNTIIPFTYIAC